MRPGSSGVIVNGLRDLYHLGAITPQQLTEARVWMSEIVVRIACERATDEDFAALDANIDAAAKAPDFDQRARHNREFHVILARATRNPIMVITMESIMAVLVTGHLLVVGLRMFRTPGMVFWACVLMLLLAAQVALGISNVKLGLPLWVAVAHNAGAALLLFTLVGLLARLRAPE